MTSLSLFTYMDAAHLYCFAATSTHTHTYTYNTQRSSTNGIFFHRNISELAKITRPVLTNFPEFDNFPIQLS